MCNRCWRTPRLAARATLTSSDLASGSASSDNLRGVDILNGCDVLQLVVVIGDSVGNGVQVLDRLIRHEQAILPLEAVEAAMRLVHHLDLFEQADVFRMHSTSHQLECRWDADLELVDAVELL